MKIMIVEDEQTIRDLVGETIEKWGLQSIKVENFNDVLQIYLMEQPNLILMDINLPAFDGFYWCTKIREVSKVPIIFISSRNTPVDMVMAMNMGGDDFIQKPFYTEVLMAKVNALLRRTYSYSAVPSQLIEHNGVILNQNEGNIIYDDQKVELTKTELVIFNLLMRHNGEIVSRKKMMRSLWEDESFVDDNTLTVNITRLRKKLAEIGKDDFITTKKGQGYLIP
ncbi:response regulator transcription factor [Gottfriedia sp. NPDC056225]|uniref:response regulator transcription factor n=1 Tax=Gottfriedia sp. NPDC056225 TaxID=3345751 RepID=UPI0035D738E6